MFKFNPITGKLDLVNRPPLTINQVLSSILLYQNNDDEDVTVGIVFSEDSILTFDDEAS